MFSIGTLLSFGNPPIRESPSASTRLSTIKSLLLVRETSALAWWTASVGMAALVTPMVPSKLSLSILGVIPRVT